MLLRLGRTLSNSDRFPDWGDYGCDPADAWLGMLLALMVLTRPCNQPGLGAAAK
jgi:hypothetical protein